MTAKRRDIGKKKLFHGASFSGSERLGQLSSSAARLSLSENVSPSAEKGPRKCRVCSIRIHWHSSGPCCWRRRDLSKILLLSRRWNAFGLTKCSILFALQPIAHIFITTSIYRSHIGSRFDCTTKGHGCVIESKPSAIGIEDGRKKSNKGKTPPRSCWGDSAKFEFRSTGKQYTSKLPSPLSSF